MPPRPTMPTSLWYGRAQPFGQPVMRTLIGSLAEAQVGEDAFRACRSRPARLAPLSVMARPQVGIAGHAMLHFRACESVSGRGNAVLVQHRIDRAAIGRRDAAEEHVLLRRQPHVRP